MLLCLRLDQMGDYLKLGGVGRISPLGAYTTLRMSGFRTFAWFERSIILGTPNFESVPRKSHVRKALFSQ